MLTRRHTLTLAAAALKDAGYADRPFDRSTAGVILGRGATLRMRPAATGHQLGHAQCGHANRATSPRTDARPRHGPWRPLRGQARQRRCRWHRPG